MTRTRVIGRFVTHPKCASCGSSTRRSALDSNIKPCESETSRKDASSRVVTTPALQCGRSPVFSSTSPAQCFRYAAVDSKPRRSSASRASGYLRSGRSPSVNRHSSAPAARPASAMARISGTDMNTASALAGSFANVQYPQLSRHARVSGMNTFGENVTTCGLGPRARVSRASAQSSSSVLDATSASTSARLSPKCASSAAVGATAESAALRRRRRERGGSRAAPGRARAPPQPRLRATAPGCGHEVAVAMTRASKVSLGHFSRVSILKRRGSDERWVRGTRLRPGSLVPARRVRTAIDRRRVIGHR